MRVTIRAVMAVVALAAVMVSFADGTTATLSWTLASANTDGTALASSDITATHLIWRHKGGTAVVGTLDVPASSTTAQVSGLACGDFEFTAETVVAGANSAETGPVTYRTGVTCTPNPPGALAVH